MVPKLFVFSNYSCLHFHRLPCALENADVFNLLDEIYLVFTSKKQISSMFSVNNPFYKTL